MDQRWAGRLVGDHRIGRGRQTGLTAAVNQLGNGGNQKQPTSGGDGGDLPRGRQHIGTTVMGEEGG